MAWNNGTEPTDIALQLFICALNAERWTVMKTKRGEGLYGNAPVKSMCWVREVLRISGTYAVLVLISVHVKL